ncbi:MAG: (d)CMP kinase [Thermoanaerobacteraceae bacterium]|nr:(d)CMP kinase [Thermoanaerobacteraceae bacterium]
MGYIIAIDGPAGAGKSTVARNLAKRLKFTYIDSGAMYRAFTFKIIENNINIEDKENLVHSLRNTDIKFQNGRVYLDNNDVTEKIRSREVDMLVSKVSSIPEIREIMVDIQKRMVINENIVMDGRDIGTVVFPDANLKIFLTASIEERARRRTKENRSKGINDKYEDVLLEIKKRDEADSNRDISPLRVANDAITIDTTNKNVEEIVNEIIFLMGEI